MDIGRFVDGLRTLVDRSALFDDQDLHVALIVNPRSGGFSRPRTHARALADIDTLLSETVHLPARRGLCSWRVLQTESPRHASSMATALVDEAALHQGSHWLVILASGDGTSLEFLDELSRSPADIMDRFTVLRLPMGTGNDGSDGRQLSDSLGRLVGHGIVEKQSFLRVIPKPGGPASVRAQNGEWRSFNIASIGLDAFVTHMTNQLKASLPGDSYRLWVDLATLFYDRVYPPREMVIRGFLDTGTVAGTPGQQMHTTELSGRFLLMAMGISGHRTYGSNKLILPDDDNVCAIRNVPLLKKIALKGPIMNGRIREFPVASLFSADKVEIDYPDRILVQMDGEAESLTAEDFPLRFERTAPVIRHLARA